MESIQTERLILRAWTLSDTEDLYEYGKSEKVGPNAGWPPHKNIEESKDIIKMFIEEDCIYAIELKSEGKVIGGIGLHERCPDKNLKHLKQREVGFVLNPSYWGKGYVPEAVNRLIDYGFNDLELDLIWCGYYEGNNNSKRVSEKCGFHYKFTKREHVKLLAVDKDVHYYCLENPNRK